MAASLDTRRAKCFDRRHPRSSDLGIQFEWGAACSVARTAVRPYGLRPVAEGTRQPLMLGPGSAPSCNAPDTDPVGVEIICLWKGKITVFNPHYPNSACAQASAVLVVPIH